MPDEAAFLLSNDSFQRDNDLLDVWPVLGLWLPAAKEKRFECLGDVLGNLGMHALDCDPVDDL